MSSLRDQEAGSPADSQSAKPADISDRSGQTRLIIEPITKNIDEIRGDIKEINKNRHDDFVKLLIMYGGGFLLLAGMIISVYLLLNNRISSINDLGIKVDTKLEELLKRIPPAQAPPPKR